MDLVGANHPYRHRIIPSSAARCGLAGAVVSTYTPGPWRWSGVGRICSIAGTYPRNIVADVWNKENGEATPEELANARLISAAPQLVEALKALVLADRLNVSEWSAAAKQADAALTAAGVTP